MTSQASYILARLRMAGGTMSIADGQLVIEAPGGAVGGELLGAIKARKSDILDLLDELDRWPDGRPGWVDGTMAGPVKPPADSPGHQAHLARIRQIVTEKVDTGRICGILPVKYNRKVVRYGKTA